MLAESSLNHRNLGPRDVEWLHLLIGDWQIIADTAHGDLILWFPQTDEKDEFDDSEAPVFETTPFVSVAQVRPSTAHTLFHRDMLEQTMGKQLQRRAWEAWSSGEQTRVSDEETVEGLPHLVRIIPLQRMGRTIALLTVHVEPFGNRQPPRIELVYRRIAEDLLQMVARTSWPELTAPMGTARGNPRVSDGVITLDAEGRVLFASPNAVSIYKRLGYEGELDNNHLSKLSRSLIPQDDKADETLPLVLTGRMPWRGEIKTRQISVYFRAIPFRRLSSLGEERYGAVLLCRDVTELRRRELELMTKDATIREIHHRVKNNLQTVSALLRLQSRRMTSDEARQGLEQAMRRVSTIAMVHEALSQGLSQKVDFDDLIQRQFRLAAELASPGQEVRTILEGKFGEMPSNFATPLALVINEVVANAVEHGLDGEAGSVTLQGERGFNQQGEPTLTVTIADDGKGMGEKTISPEAGKREGLGLQIVRTLVASELNGTIRWEANEPTGTRVIIQAVLSGPKR